MSPFGNPDTNWLDDAAHHAWLRAHRTTLLDFYQPSVRLPGAGFAYLDSAGQPLPDQGSQLWLGARMTHCFSVAAMEGRPGARDIAAHGVDFYLRGAGRDHDYGGWFATVGGSEPNDRKELYGQAFVLLAASSAALAGVVGGDELLREALAVLDRFWVEEDGRALEAFDRTFTTADTYRGQNANMHLTEAYLAAYEATGDPAILNRAARIAQHIAGGASSSAEGAWRLPEHFDERWQPLLDHNRAEPRHPFRPYGSQPGHWLEWTKLLLQLRGLGASGDWIDAAATNLFEGAYADAWAANGGFCYTVDWDGTPVVPERYAWEVAEGLGAAAALFRLTGDQRFADRYDELWDYVDRVFIDHEHGSWFPEVDVDNRPVVGTWAGKPDLYHAYQATYYAFLPVDKGIAAWAAEGRTRGSDSAVEIADDRAPVSPIVSCNPLVAWPLELEGRDGADDDDRRRVDARLVRGVGNRREVPRTLTCCGVVPSTTTAAGVSAGSPLTTSSRAIAARFCTPISTTMVRFDAASAPSRPPTSVAGRHVPGHDDEPLSQPTMRDGGYPPSPVLQRPRSRQAPPTPGSPPPGTPTPPPRRARRRSCRRP